MTSSQYNPEIHHRRSIRLKGHDYAGGGLYFVTICAHRDFIDFARGEPFGAATARATCVSRGEQRATCVSPVRKMMAEEWARSGALRDDVFPDEFVVMPDHFHGLIRIEKGQSALGHVIGAFKAAVSRRIRRRGDMHVARDTHVVEPRNAPSPAPPPNVRIWHRNYYERIVRTPEAAERIAEYIRMNPWKLVQHGVHEGRTFRMIGNPALLQHEKIALLCSRNCPPDVLAGADRRASSAGANCCFISGFHAPPEQAILNALLRSDARLICCPAWGIDEMRIPREWLPALEANRMLILEMHDHAGNLAAAEARNRLVLQSAGKRWIPHVAKGGMLERLIGERELNHGKHGMTRK